MNFPPPVPTQAGPSRPEMILNAMWTPHDTPPPGRKFASS